MSKIPNIVAKLLKLAGNIVEIIMDDDDAGEMRLKDVEGFEEIQEMTREDEAVKSFMDKWKARNDEQT
jgi:hypothetical protein